MADQDDIDGFHYHLSDFEEGGSPVALRRLMLASIRLMDCDVPLSKIQAKQLKRITGKLHRTYQSGVQGLLATRFNRSGNYWATFLVGRSLYPFPEERGSDELAGTVPELSDKGRVWRLLRFVWPVRRTGSE